MRGMCSSSFASLSSGQARSLTVGPPLILHPAIAGSWRRRAHRLFHRSGASNRAFLVSSTRPLPAEKRVQHADLIQIASAEIDWLYEYIAGSGYALVLTDASGIVLYEKTDSTLVDVFRSAGLELAPTGANARKAPTASAPASPRTGR